MNTNFFYHLGFSYCLGVGPQRFKRLLEYYGEIKKAYNAPLQEITSLLGRDAATKFCHSRARFDPITEWQRIKAKGITVLTQEDNDYPEIFKKISDAPICLYLKGNVEKIKFQKDFFFGVVGTRQATANGLQITQMLVSELAEAGMVIVSGLALGIDAAAHRAALMARGRTVAFLGCGVDIVYPYKNRELYKDIISKGGVIISEFPPGETVKKGLFVSRNRLISGLSRGVLVVEGTNQSGALITARDAADQGKDVFVPLVPMNSRFSETPIILLRSGAKLVMSAEDILQEYKMEPAIVEKKSKEYALKKTELILYSLIKNEPRPIDELIVQSHMPVGEVLSELTSLEIKGAIEKNIEGNYQVVL